MLKKFNILFDIISDQRKQIEALKEENARLKEINKRNERLLNHCYSEMAKEKKK